MNGMRPVKCSYKVIKMERSCSMESNLTHKGGYAAREQIVDVK